MPSVKPSVVKPSTEFIFEDLKEEDTREVIFRPNPGPQTAFLAAVEKEVLYGGAAGGGKSYGILADALRDMDHPSFRGLLLRKTTEELRELVLKSQELYPKAIPGIKWSQQKMTWTTPKGGILWMSYLDRDEEVTRYQGQSFSYIAFDELTQWATPYCWDYMRSRLRTTDPSLSVYMRATSNPGGLGHHWVKKMFIDPAPWGKAFWATDVETGETLIYPEVHLNKQGFLEPHPKAGQPLFQRRFIPARLSDNPYLYDAGDYEAMLLSLPEYERKRLLEGDWDVVAGAAFPEWNRAIHVIEPFEIPNGWKKFRACDYGYGSYAAVLWFAVAPDDQIIVYDEIYVSKRLAVDLADDILYRERGHRISYGMMDRSCWYVKGEGPCIAEQMEKRGCRWRKADGSKGSRIAGKNEIHRRLQIDEDTEEPRMVIFSSCINLIRQLPMIPLDKDNVEDVDTDAEDHLYDALRYGLMSRPRNSLFDISYKKNANYRPFDPVFGH